MTTDPLEPVPEPGSALVPPPRKPPVAVEGTDWPDGSHPRARRRLPRRVYDPALRRTAAERLLNRAFDLLDELGDSIRRDLRL